jgi:DNA-binding transcriptional MerR regulator
MCGRIGHMEFVTIEKLSELTSIPVRSLRTLKNKGVVPFIKTGHRQLFFQPEKVRRALEKFEIRKADK